MDGLTKTKLQAPPDINTQLPKQKKHESKMIKFKFLTLFQKNDQN